MKKWLAILGIIFGSAVFYAAMFTLNRAFDDGPVGALTDLIEYSREGDFDRASSLLTNETDSTGSTSEGDGVQRLIYLRLFADIEVSSLTFKVLKRSERSASVLVVPARASKALNSMVFTLYKKPSGWKVHSFVSKDLHDLNEKIFSELSSEGG